MATTLSKALSRCDMTTCGMRASTKRQIKNKESRMQAESKIQGSTNASRRGQTNTATRRCQEKTVSRRDGTTLPLANAGRKTKEDKLLFPHHGTRDAFELIRICWTLKTKFRKQGCFPIDSQLIGHFQTKRQALLRVSRLHSGSLWPQSKQSHLTEQGLQNRTCLFNSSHAMHGQTRLR